MLELANFVYLTAPFSIDMPHSLLQKSEVFLCNPASNDNVAPKRFALFISHLAAERETAGQLKVEFEQLGIDAFVAHDDIQPTSDWQLEIEQTLSKCDALVALLHPDFHTSSWTDQEIGWALGRKLPVYPVRLGADPYGFFGKVQAFNGLGKTPCQIANEIFSALAKEPRTALQISASLVKLVEEANSYAQAKSRVCLLDSVVAWKPCLTEALRKAVAENEQIKGAWNVPSRIDSFIAKFA